MGMTVTALLTFGVAIAYVGLGTVRFKPVVSAIVIYMANHGIPTKYPPYMPTWLRGHFEDLFALSARVFFLGCAVTHFELAAHAYYGDLPADYGELFHQLVMFIQGLGAWLFVYTVTMINDADNKINGKAKEKA